MGIHDWINNIGYTDDRPARIVRLMVYGEPGAGKTYLAGTFPHPFFIDADHGLRTLKKKRFPYVAPTPGGKTYYEVMDMLKTVEKREPPFDEIPVETVVLDSITELARMLLEESMRYPEGAGSDAPRKITADIPSFHDWSRLTARLESIMKQCETMGVNIVATAGVNIDKDEYTGALMGNPAIVGGYRKIIGHRFDEFFYMEPQSDKDGGVTYTVHTVKYRHYAAKSRDGRKGTISNPTFQSLFPQQETGKETQGESK